MKNWHAHLSALRFGITDLQNVYILDVS